MTHELEGEGGGDHRPAGDLQERAAGIAIVMLAHIPEPFVRPHDGSE